MRLSLLLALTTLSLSAAATDPVQPDPDATNASLRARVVSEAVAHDSDDPAIWIHPDDPASSLIVGTDKDKEGALYLFNLQGKVVARSQKLRRPNNVDLVQGWRPAPGKPAIDLAVTTERHERRLRVFAMPSLACLDRGDLQVFEGDETRAPMGVALYHRASDGALFAIVGGKSGPTHGYLWQYRLEMAADGLVSMSKVRAFGDFSGRKEIEAIAVDSEAGFVYYADEQYGIHKYRADPDASLAAEELALFGTSGFASDIEGISIRRTGARTGFLVVSNQQADTFRVFPREGTLSSPHHHPLLGSVRLSTRESDGSDVTSVPLPGFPGGLFVAMSADRTFHFYAWEDLAAVLGIK